jgi:tRNA nucleotidyltransferase (CCA-adding enzyme)
VFDKAIEICKVIKMNKGRAFFAGGWVRDKFMNRPSDDIDIEVFGLEREHLEAILANFGEVKLVGRAYGVYKIDGLDISMPRREHTTGPKHGDITVEVDKDLSLPDACVRRDLTINAMLYDPLEEKIHDFFNGVDHIQQRSICHVDNVTFVEDPLRIIRAARFASTLDFGINMGTYALCSAYRQSLKELPKERIFWETEKALMNAERPSKFFKSLNGMDALDILFPELSALQAIDQGNTHHTEGNAFVHTMMAIDVLPIEERDLAVMFAILFHDLGKVSCRTEDANGVHFYGHHMDGIPLYESAMERLTSETLLTWEVGNLALHHMDVWPLIEHCRKKTIRKLAAKTDIYKLLQVHKGDRLGRGVPATIDHIERIISVYEEVKDEIKPMIQGRHLIELGETPGKHFSGILNEIWEAQLDGQFSTVEEGIAYARTKISRR